MSKERTWPQLVAVITINDIEPLRKQYQLAYKDISPDETYLISSIILKEFNKEIDRKKTRECLDFMFYAIKKRVDYDKVSL